MLRITRLIGIALMWLALPAWPRESVLLEYAVPGEAPRKVSAIVRQPLREGNGQAILLLHHAGGFAMGTTTQYAEMFVERGFTTLELKMFDQVSDARPAVLDLYAMMASGLRYLAQQQSVKADKVSAMGLSLGAFMTIHASTRWFYDHHQLGPLRFHRLAAVYPVCWMMSEALKGQTQGIGAFKGMPSNAMQNFEQVPLLILAGGKDHYDGSNPSACPDFVQSIPDQKQAQLTQVKVYPEATHGWDHGHTYSFMAFNACPNRSTCRNFNVSSPATVHKGKQDLLAFFTQP